MPDAWRRSALVAGLLAAAGCDLAAIGAGEDSGGRGSGPTRCATDRDCPEDMLCAQGLCQFGERRDAGGRDPGAAPSDGSAADTAVDDRWSLDAAATDAAPSDRAAPDRAALDARPRDLGSTDAAQPDLGGTDATQRDHGGPDTAPRDAALADAGARDRAAPDTAPLDVTIADATPRSCEGPSDCPEPQVCYADRCCTPRVSCTEPDPACETTPDGCGGTIECPECCAWQGEHLGSFGGDVWPGLAIALSPTAPPTPAQPRVALRSAPEGIVSYLERSPGPEWSPLSVGIPQEPEPNAPLGVDLAIDGSDRPHVVYNLSDGALYYEAYDGMAWARELVFDAGEPTSWPAMALDSAGTAHVLFNRLLYGRRDEPGVWSVFTMPSMENVPGTVDVVMDEQDVLHVVFQDAAQGSLWYISIDTASGLASPMESIDGEDAPASGTGAGCAVVVDETGRLHVSYSFTAADDLQEVAYATKADGEDTWLVTHLNAVTTKRGATAVAAVGGTPIVAYVAPRPDLGHPGYGDLALATTMTFPAPEPEQWLISGFPAETFGTPIDSPALVQDRYGCPHFALRAAQCEECTGPTLAYFYYGPCGACITP